MGSCCSTEKNKDKTLVDEQKEGKLEKEKEKRAVQKLQKHEKQIEPKQQTFRIRLENQLIKKGLLKHPDCLNREAKYFNQLLNQEEFDNYAKNFQRVNQHNPFSSSVRRLYNGTVYWSSNKKCEQDHIFDVLNYSQASKRYVHINTGTHGYVDGSTVFWKSNETIKSLNNSVKLLKDWIKGANLFAEQDMESIERLANLGTPFSMTWVNKDTPPQYPVNCDVIDAWEYSQNTPRCPEEIVVKIKGFKNDIEGLWENLPAKNQSDIVQSFLAVLRDENAKPKRKTDNILMILFHGMKIINIPQQQITKFQKFVRNNLETAKDCKVKNIHEIQTLVSEIVYSDVRFYIIVSRMFNVISCVKDMKLKSVNKLDKSKVGYTIQMQETFNKSFYMATKTQTKSVQKKLEEEQHVYKKQAKIRKKFEEVLISKCLLKFPNALNQEARGQNNQLRIQEFIIFRDTFAELFPDNPFRMALLENGTVHYTSDDEVTSKHAFEILKHCLKLNRYVHINTGTPGREDGSTDNWMSDDVEKELLERTTQRIEWVKESNIFFEDRNQIEKIVKYRHPFSITCVTAETEPEYPEYCDVIDCWNFSQATPRCPKEIVSGLNNFHDVTADLWKKELTKKQKSGIVKRFLILLKKEIEAPKRKTDNILMILFHGMKMMKLPQDYINQVYKYVKMNHEVETVEQLRALFSKDIYSDRRYFNILTFIFDLITDGTESQFKKRAFQKIELEIISSKKSLSETLTQTMKIKVIKSLPEETIFTKGKVFRITPQGFENDKISEREIGTGEVYIGRKDKEILNDFPLSSKYVSRRQLLIQFMDKQFYVRDKSKSSPSCLQISSHLPISLKEGMILFAGDGETTRFMEVTKLDQSNKLSPHSKKYDQLLQIVTEEDHYKFGNQIYSTVNSKDKQQTQNEQAQVTNEIEFTTIFAESNKSFKFRPQGTQTTSIPITSDMRRKRDPKYLWIESSESPSDTGKVWGYLEHETECGWFIRATKEGEKLANQLKILMKTKDQFSQSKDSHFILLQDKMQICLEQGYIIECEKEQIWM